MRFFGSLLLTVALLASPDLRAQDDESCALVRFGTVGWLDAGASVSMATALLRGLGYDGTYQQLPVPTILTSMKNRDLDAFLEIMVPTMGAAIKPYILDNSIELIGKNLSGTKYTLAVNSAGRELGIEHFKDLVSHETALSNSIHGVDAGSDGNALIAQIIEDNAFGLGGFQLVESREDQLIRAISEANRDGRPMVFLGWEPHPMNFRFNLTYLSGGDKYFGPSFGGADVYTGLRASFTRDCPNLTRLFKNLELSLPMVNEIMTAILELKAQPLVAAVTWLRQQPIVLETWLNGVRTRDGAPGLAAVLGFIGLDSTR